MLRVWSLVVALVLVFVKNDDKRRHGRGSGAGERTGDAARRALVRLGAFPSRGQRVSWALPAHVERQALVAQLNRDAALA